MILAINEVFFEICRIVQHFILVSLMFASKKITAIQIFKIYKSFKNVLVLLHTAPPGATLCSESGIRS